MSNTIKLFIVWALVLCILIVARTISASVLTEILMKITISMLAAISLYLLTGFIKYINGILKDRKNKLKNDK
ncbi:hypothetical protein [Bacillus bombysepticus]|uniref:hypothetical protein n=1 Tax=Bacillus bombysepticus TaxID=658666 RepID=UPI003016298B